MRMISLKEFFNKTVPKEHLEEFLQNVKLVNDTRKKNFFKLFIFIQLVVLITSIFNIHIMIFRYIIWMSITMIVLSALSLIILYKANDSIKMILEFPILFSVMLWSVSYAFIDSNFYGLNMIYISTIIFLSAMHLGPSKIIKASLLAQIIFIIGIINFSQSKEQLLINVVDTTILVTMACFLAIKMYHNFINSFNKNKIIENRSEDLNIINKRLEKEIYDRKVIAYHLKESKEKFRLFTQNSPSSIAVIQHDKIVYANPSTVKLTGYEVEELYKMNWSDLIHEDMRDSIKRSFLEVQLGEEFIDCNEVKVQSKSGQIHWINLSVNRVLNYGEIGVIVNAYDISEEKEAKKRLERLMEIKESLFEITQSIIGTDDIFTLYNLILNKALEIIDHASVGSILVLDENNRLVPVCYKGHTMEDMKEFSIPLEESFIWIKTSGKIEKTVIINDVENLHANKQNYNPKVIRSLISSPIIIHDKLYGVVNIDSKNKNAFTEEDKDIFDYYKKNIEIALSKHLLYEEIINLSRYDKLTNVYNRRYFEELFEQHFRIANKINEQLFFVIFDLNGMKEVNDIYGHLAGDKFLKKFANTINANIRDTDLFARYGGDEFVAVFFNIKQIDLELKLEKINRDLIRNPLDFKGDSIQCSFSYGISNFPNEAKNYNDLVKLADERMYSYKEKIKAELKNME